MRHKPVIVIMGTDGAGKTTLLNAALPTLEKDHGGHFVVHHLKPDLLPPLGRLRGVRHTDGYTCNDPHGSPPSGFIGSMVRIMYLTLDYWLGYWLKVRRQLRQPIVAGWIFDRYAYDMLIDPLRFRIRLPTVVIRLFLWLVPQPDCIVCLGGDPKKIFSRKPETSLAEVTRQVDALKTFCKSTKRGVWIDTSRELCVCVDELRTVLKEI